MIQDHAQCSYKTIQLVCEGKLLVNNLKVGDIRRSNLGPLEMVLVRNRGMDESIEHLRRQITYPDYHTCWTTFLQDLKMATENGEDMSTHAAVAAQFLQRKNRDIKSCNQMIRACQVL